jgi:oligopeptide/dipeptide ABC transporter ATP-binding protein
LNKSSQTLLTVEQLTTQLPTHEGVVHAVDGVSFTLSHGETLAIVGESGSGKSMLCRTILGLLPKQKKTYQHPEPGRIIFDGKDLGNVSHHELMRIRGKEIAVVLQDPMSSLNPTMTIGKQIAEPLRYHMGMRRRTARVRAIELLNKAGLPQPEHKVDVYPHQLSGGMRQRVAIAMALACEPKLLIADEPTTALDVTVQAEILNLLDRLQSERNMAMILVTHDLGVVAGRAQQTAVMYAGKIVEQAPTKELFTNMRMPYTKALFDSIPNMKDPVGKRLKTIEGHPPTVSSKRTGCPFAPRCPKANQLCYKVVPGLGQDHLNHAHYYACWHPLRNYEGQHE